MIRKIDHLVITVSDLIKTRQFYCDLLGMSYEAFGEGRHALHFGTQKINLHIQGKELEPKAEVALPGTADLCFEISATLEDAREKLLGAGVDILEGPVRRTGASGPITSIYVRDPDLNLIELSVYDN